MISWTNTTTATGRRWICLAGILWLTGAMASAAAGAGPASGTGGAAKAALGINLHGPADWNTELPFVDVFRMSRPWISQRAGAAWGKGPALALDSHGWVTRLAKGCWAETLLCTIDGGHYPAGRYTVLYEGSGTIDFGRAVKLAAAAPGRIAIDVDPAKGAIFLRIKATDREDYIRNIRVIMPGFEGTYRQNPWHPAFLARWRGVACVRFMDWMKTNNSRVATWPQRPKTDDATCSRRGVPLELMIDLCNRLGADAWFCMPHLAGDEYVRNFAKQVKSGLDPGLKVYIEYSNEVWNGMFAQSRWAGVQGVRLGLAPKGKPREAAWHYTAVRSVQIFKIWEQVFGGTARLVRVLPTQAASTHVSTQVLTYRDAYKHADALGVAPYVGFGVRATGEGLTAAKVRDWTVEQVLDHLETAALPTAIRRMGEQKALAEKHGLKLIAYEAGQHAVGIRGGENDTKLTALLHAANAHPRMAEIYRRYLKGWADSGGGLLCHFSSVGKWSKWGSWGAMQYYDDDPAKSPKYRAIMRWARDCGQPVRVPRPR